MSKLDTLVFCTVCDYSIHLGKCDCSAGPTYPKTASVTGIKRDQDTLLTEEGIRRIVREEIAKSQEPQWKSA